MAKKKKKSTKKKSSVAGTCRVIRVNGKRRELCWNKKGRIKSNRAA